MNTKLLSIAVGFVIFTSGCVTARLPVDIPGGQGAQETQQAEIERAVQATATIAALQTQISSLETQVARPTTAAGQTQIVVIATPEPPTVTPSATSLPLTSTATPQPPTATAVSTATAVPPTRTLTATSTPLPCNQASFKADVTVPDGTAYGPGTSFTKTWRLENTGSCTWTTAYDLVFVSGAQMGGLSVDLPGSVTPGQLIDLSVNLTAPLDPGSYRGNWKLRDANGVVFGLGKTGGPFYVDIKVTGPASGPLDMVAMYCTAEWTSGGNRLPCPGVDNDSRGFVLRIEKPVLESGYIDDEPVLLTHPQMLTDSVIQGKYPVMRVEDGYHFVAAIGCAYQATGCDVKFQLDYQAGSSPIQTLATWHEVYDETFRPVDVDLSSLAGKDVKFILTVHANGTATGDRAQWLLPRIVKK